MPGFFSRSGPLKDEAFKLERFIPEKHPIIHPQTGLLRRLCRSKVREK
jgi:hypothetical protein